MHWTKELKKLIKFELVSDKVELVSDKVEAEHTFKNALNIGVKSRLLGD